MLVKSQPLPRGKIRGAWDVVKAHLKRPGTTLTRYVKTWQLGDGDDVDRVEPKAWTADLFPLVRLELEASSSEWVNQAQTQIPVAYKLTIAVAGSDHGDVFDAFEVLVAHLYPGDKSLYGRLAAFGVMSYTLSAPAITRARYEDGQGQVATCVLTLLMRIPTAV